MKFDVTCIIGSMRFYEGMLKVAEKLTANGHIVLMPFVTKNTETDNDMLDRMHRIKMNMADYIVLVTDDSGYFGESTAAELDYAASRDKVVVTEVV